MKKRAGRNCGPLSEMLCYLTKHETISLITHLHHKTFRCIVHFFVCYFWTFSISSQQTLLPVYLILTEMMQDCFAVCPGWVPLPLSVYVIFQISEQVGCLPGDARYAALASDWLAA